jgi:hypothetical protein
MGGWRYRSIPIHLFFIAPLPFSIFDLLPQQTIMHYAFFWLLNTNAISGAFGTFIFFGFSFSNLLNKLKANKYGACYFASNGILNTYKSHSFNIFNHK